jgi:hypothetical protein
VKGVFSIKKEPSVCCIQQTLIPSFRITQVHPCLNRQELPL